MKSLLDQRRLLAFSQFRRQRGEQAVLRVQRQLLPLRQEQSAVEEQEAALQRLLNSHQANDCVLDHGQLLALLRTQAVIRRRIDLLRVERDRVDQQYRQVEQQLQAQREQLRGLQRRHDKYARSIQQLLRGQRLEAVRREERELEEMIGVRR
ncbi:surface presentation of antigen gene type M protein [Pseudomonas sp. NFACC15-1]|uniref:type III secretion protein n=1 Tax=unclassified Pseudomonas TaxID=196821 RepID=UPI00087E6AB5|nr:MULTISPECIES: type III secretion protein [unclassified Pseudomonas]SDA41636.1 surface presentation of antigen gene type M protein [Pseudomonas sp. NFACC15-1]SDW40200.1 surface presentation of antigen gene type M protein [Pseudomonas sp. NFACC14]